LKQFAPFRLDTANECLWRGEERIALQPKPFAVLRYLVEKPGQLITHDELLDALWPETYVQPQVLRTYMLELRKILGDDAAAPRFIATVPKRGYRFVAAVTEAEAAGRVASSGLASAGSAMASRAPAIGTVQIIGREEELARLQAELERMAAGQRRMALVSGEVGIGKTALVDAFSEAACAGNGAVAARGQCVPGVGSKEEYYPVMEALGHLCAEPEGETACRTLRRVAPAWLAMLGIEAATAGGVERERMPGSLCAALEEMSVARPLILIFEDLQWADSATLNLIAALARRRAATKLMVLATYRPRSVAAGHPLKPLKQELLMQRLCTEIALGPLDTTAMMKLLGRELETETVPQQLGNFIYVHAEGNPLFAIVLLRHLIAQKFLVRKGNNGEGEWRLTANLEEVDAGVPDELAQMVELEIERLTAEEQSLLEAGSMMNIAFPAWAVAAALGRDVVETEEACDALAQKVYFVQRAGQDELPNGGRSAFYAFSHGLYREVLYQRQSAARRAQRHIRIAERLGELFAGRQAHVAREMALHFEAAESWQRSARARRDAAQYAREREAHTEAAELLEKAMTRAEHLSQAEVAEIRAELEQARLAIKKASKTPSRKV
jgi:predicted ATPase/DNA-binding winged helix-turn-helix (wHTH) protein